jgi:type IV secretion system protein VirB9
MQFPEGVANRDLPVLFVLENREKELVNFRFKSPYFVVDKLFKKAVLVIGVGSTKKSVTITNNCVK